MDSSPVSAFSIYKATNQLKPKQNQNKKKKKRKGRGAAPNTELAAIKNIKISNGILKQGVEKTKKKLKNEKQPKVIGKTKTHKKNKNLKERVKNPKGNKIVEIKPENHNGTLDLSEDSDVQDLPVLIPVSDFNHGYLSDASSSSSGMEFTPVQTDSAEEGLKVFKWMIAPYDPDKFLNHIWEKKPLHISRKKPLYYSELISTPIIDELLRNKDMRYGTNIDITSYFEETRRTHNPLGRAYPHVVWESYLNGCSVRVLHPQKLIPKLQLVNATLQEFFNSYVGANAYLTPPDSQGFAPHFDDIEAFALQVEGKKHWRIYKPRNAHEVLPRVSSGNFDQSEIGKPIKEVTLEAGDMLYFPRGYIHQAVTVDGEHSLHVTVSMYQKHSWADLLESLIPCALESAITNHVDLRRGLPFDIYDNFGLLHPNSNIPRRKQIEDLVRSLFDKIKDHLNIDEAVDEMSKIYQKLALPPVLSDLEKAVSLQGDTNVMIENGKVVNRVELNPDTRIRLLRKNILRVVKEGEAFMLYHHNENSLTDENPELVGVEIEKELLPAVETLIRSYPEYVAIEDLNNPSESVKMGLADDLWLKGVIMTEYPMETIDDD